MKRKPKNPLRPYAVIRARLALILKLVDAIATLKDPRDEDALSRTINAWLPDTYAEAQADIDEELAKWDSDEPSGEPSPAMKAIQDLRKLLGFTKEDSMFLVLEAAANVLRNGYGG